MFTARKDTLCEGFTMTFANGYTISVQFGITNLCSRDKNKAVSAEIAIWDKDGTWYNFGHDSVKGHCSPDEVVTWMRKVKDCEYTGDKWVLCTKLGDTLNNANAEPYVYDSRQEAMEDVGYDRDKLFPTMVMDLSGIKKELVLAKELNQVIL